MNNNIKRNDIVYYVDEYNEIRSGRVMSISYPFGEDDDLCIYILYPIDLAVVSLAFKTRGKAKKHLKTRECKEKSQ